jgi:hypothetical protein
VAGAVSAVEQTVRHLICDTKARERFGVSRAQAKGPIVSGTVWICTGRQACVGLALGVSELVACVGAVVYLCAAWTDGVRTLIEYLRPRRKT